MVGQKNGRLIGLKECTVRDMVVKVGDSVDVHNHENKNWVGKVFGIFQKEKVYAEVEWYYGKDEIPNAPNFFLAHEELALSYHMDLIDVETINSICRAYTKPEYDGLKKPEDDDYFCRFRYCQVSNKFMEIRVWNMPPEKSQTLVECDTCFRWYHDTCMDKTSKCIGCDGSFFSPRP